jgi:nitrate reductase NapAB chaperone NapD
LTLLAIKTVFRKSKATVIMGDHKSDDKFVVSSLVVSTHEGLSESIANVISALDGVEIVKAQGGKFAVVLETESIESAVELTERIRNTEGVAGVKLVAHFFEHEVADDFEPFD